VRAAHEGPLGGFVEFRLGVELAWFGEHERRMK
jgi:hypothetical protein